MMRVRCSDAGSEARRLTAVVVLPTPPFWLAIAITRATNPPTARAIYICFAEVTRCFTWNVRNIFTWNYSWCFTWNILDKIRPVRHSWSRLGVLRVLTPEFLPENPSSNQQSRQFLQNRPHRP